MSGSAPPPTVGVIGVGLMGLAIALRLRDAGTPVTVRDLLPAREALAARAGAQVADTAAAVGSQCRLVIVVVVDAAQTQEVLFGAHGAAAAMSPGSCVMLCPTIAPADVEQLAERLAKMGIGCIDAPMSGGPARARDGTMSLMVACEDACFERHRPLLAHLSSRLFFVGARCGDGARTKLVNNLLAAVNLAAACEAIALAESLGLDAARTLAVIAQSSGQSWIGVDRLTRALDGDATPQARMALLAKDSALALAMAAQAGLAPELGAQAARAFQEACASGLGDEDDSRLLSPMRSRLQRPPPARPDAAESAP